MTNEEELSWLLDRFERSVYLDDETYPRYYVQFGTRTYWFASYPPAERLADVLTDMHSDRPSPEVFARDSWGSTLRPIVWRNPEVRQEMHARFGYFEPQARARIVSNRLPG